MEGIQLGTENLGVFSRITQDFVVVGIALAMITSLYFLDTHMQ